MQGVCASTYRDYVGTDLRMCGKKNIDHPRPASSDYHQFRRFPANRLRERRKFVGSLVFSVFGLISPRLRPTPSSLPVYTRSRLRPSSARVLIRVRGNSAPDCLPVPGPYLHRFLTTRAHIENQEPTDHLHNAYTLNTWLTWNIYHGRCWGPSFPRRV